MLRAGERLWNGYVVTKTLADTYNRLSQRIEQFEHEGKAAPEIEPDGTAAAELEALYNFAKEIMTHGNRDTEKPATRA